MTKIKAILFCVFTVVALTACEEKDLSKGQPEPEKKVSDLNIPMDFDWKTTNVVTCNLASEVNTRVRIYNEESCADESLLAIYTVTPNGENPLKLHLPINLKTVYVKLGDQVFPADIEDFNINVNLPGTRSVQTNNDESCDGCQDDDVTYFPCKGEQATMMFEDYFPDEGDYDFNDFVINYNYAIYYKPRSAEILKLDFSMTVVALGGIFPYDPCFRLEGILTDCVRAISKYGEFDFASFGDYDGDVCLVMTGLTDKPAGCEFLNTKTSETIVPYSELKTARFVIAFNTEEGRMIPKMHQFDAFNIFLDNKTLEIHEKGFPPARRSYPNFKDKGDDYYNNCHNLVWALTVPTKIRHAKERVDFLKAYPSFIEWAESCGEEATNWYYNQAEEHLFSVPGYNY